MVFSSITFLVYFLPVFLLLYFVLPVRFKNIFLLLSSIAFYSWGAPLFIYVILGTTAVDFFLVQQMDKANKPLHKKILLLLSLSLNLGLLLYFKYCNFFVENVNIFLAAIGFKQIEWVKVLLPIGISFYTFESLTYVIDVYWGVHKPLKNFWHYQLYITLFPKLIAGPIVRYHEIADQITGRFATDNIDNKLGGFYRFCIGLAKKVLIANVMAVYANELFDVPLNKVDGNTAWVGMLAYTFQIYFDFSGYSDMAIGLGKMLGFKFPENFDNPYTSGSITEFWRRWHMTLGNWMRNYLYIPLGGNKVLSSARLYMNLWIVFIISGFWHGADWTFIFWGVYHGLFLVLERLFLLRIYRRLGSILPVFITFMIVAIGWIFFRADTLEQAFSIVQKLTQAPTFVLNHGERHLIIYMIVAAIFSFITLTSYGKKMQDVFYTKILSLPQHLLVACISLLLFLICLGSIASSQVNPFIYFRF